MLRYLRSGEQAADEDENKEPSMEWLENGSLEANQNSDLQKGVDALQAARSKKHNADGFGWRSGKDRCTTGIWMWSESFPREIPGGNTIQVLLVDTQGMFDSTLGQMLTASIFGLSTLISSYQIYNVDKRIQEDNLQHLALFTEYGRVALEEEKKASGNTNNSLARPFQRLEFLVRDWQSFEDENAHLQEMRTAMDSYLKEVLDEREQKDLKQVRKQISDCFDVVSCYLLPHPGLDIPKGNYDGNVATIRKEFRRMLSDYVRRVFSQRLVPKRIHGQPVTGPELFNYIQAYCKLFKEAKIFPEAKTLLEATAEANNRSALEAAIREYRIQMDAKTKRYVEEAELLDAHKAAKRDALALYSKKANIGPKQLIIDFKTRLEDDLQTVCDEYKTLNRLRDPFGFVAPYVVPILIALGAYIIRFFLDIFCTGWSNTCTKSSQFMGQVYSTVFFFILIHLVAMGHGVRGRLQAMFSMIKLPNQ
jgi:atlastin